MNTQDRDDMQALKIEVTNNTKQLEKITTNDLPHIYKTLWKIVGSLWVLIPLVMILVGLVIGLYCI